MSISARQKEHDLGYLKKFAPSQVLREDLGDGAFVLRSPYLLDMDVKCVSEYLERWAEEAPDRLFLAERGPGGEWISVTYSEALAQTRSLAAFLLNKGLGKDRPLLILSGNSVRHGLLMLAAMHVGIPVVPVSVPYSLFDESLAKLRHIVRTTNPGMAYADDAKRFAHAFEFLASEGIEQMSDNGALTFEHALEATADEPVAQARATIDHNTLAKILFTSGSTGLPKGVIVTQRMMLATQEAVVQIWPFLESAPPVVIDWLPWNHTFGGNFNFNMMLRNGGSFYVDDGKPVPGEIEKTIRNVRDVIAHSVFQRPARF